MANYTSAYTGAEIDSAVQKANHLVDYVYPVGSIYMSVNSTSPQTLFGGTWVELQGRFLIGRNSTYTAGSTGGSATATLSLNQSPLGNFLSGGKNTGVSLVLQNDGNLVIYKSNGTAAWNSGTAGNAGSTGYTFTNKGDTGGGGQAHNNMPPYLAVYMWKRTA